MVGDSLTAFKSWSFRLSDYESSTTFLLINELRWLVFLEESQILRYFSSILKGKI